MEAHAHPEETPHETPTLDVSHLPGSGIDDRHPAWWGNAQLLLIETMTVALLVASYLYVRKNFGSWPPPRVNEFPPLARPLPDLLPGTAGTIVLLLIAVAVIAVDRAARRRFAEWERATEPHPAAAENQEGALAHRRTAPVIATMVGIGIAGLAASLIRFAEFRGLHVSWDDNVHGSLVWSILGLHLFYVLTSAVETLLAAVWVGRYGLTQKLSVDLTLLAIMWYWTIAVWLVLYGLVYWLPRVTPGVSP
jgi:heme/copper-type cytochrome/quinol oxidase subunit 3